MRLTEIGVAKVIQEGGERSIRLPECMDCPSTGLSLTSVRMPHRAVMYVHTGQLRPVLETLRRGGREEEPHVDGSYRLICASILESHVAVGGPLGLPRYVEQDPTGTVLWAKIEHPVPLLLVCSARMMMQVFHAVCHKFGDILFTAEYGGLRITTDGRQAFEA
jgi:hypothetical protein